MKDKPKNVAQSVRDRLKAAAPRLKLDYNLILIRYVLERLLFRLSASPHNDRFALKGAMLFAAWTEDVIRPTRDLDLLGFGASEIEAIRGAFADILQTQVPDDGVVFDVKTLVAEPIRADQLYDGVRVSTLAFIGSARVPVQIDIGFGDAVTPGLDERDYPTLLGMPAPRLKTYPRETVVAEKFEAIVSIGVRTSRMKDFYDLFCLARMFEFDGETLSAAIRATFDRRGTAVPTEPPPALSAEFAEEADVNERWTAFVSRTPLLVAPPPLAELIDELQTFVLPPARLATGVGERLEIWSADTGWTMKTPTKS
ncbi:MAG TPA: nucleotidyl transferase AbiEii/AbiGii toxin family protein [Parvularculaceae bacterium]|nr:nucleotidyl transferase AbiEii/AbiGii toxin family protein [Parvularculaceae bacterium]